MTLDGEAMQDNTIVGFEPLENPGVHIRPRPITVDEHLNGILANMGQLSDEGLKTLHDAVGKEIVSRWTK